MVVSDVDSVESVFQRIDDLGVAMPQIERAAVRVHVDEGFSVDVLEHVSLAFSDDERDPLVDPEIGLVGIPVLPRCVEDFRLIRETVHRVVVAIHALVLPRSFSNQGKTTTPDFAASIGGSLGRQYCEQVKRRLTCVRAYHFQTSGTAAWYASGSTWFLTALPQRQSQLRRGPFQGGDDDGRRKARFKAFFANRLSLM